MITIDKVPVPETTGEGVGQLIYKNGKLMAYEHGSIVNVYLFHETDEENVTRALELTMDVPLTRDKCINAAEMAVYGLRDALDVAAFTASLARKQRMGEDMADVLEHDRFMASVKEEVDKVVEGTDPNPEPTTIDYTKYEPYRDDLIEKLKQLLQTQVAQQTDEEALENIELFPTWQSKIGQQVSVGDRLYHDDRLWKVLQTHTVQEDWKPDVTASLFVQVVVESEQGTIDNPIPYSVNMELIEGKYYSEDGVTYRCIRALAQSVWHLADLVGNFVEVV